MPSLVFGDLHLTSTTPSAVVQSFHRVVQDHPGSRIVCVGDLFDLPAEGGSSDGLLSMAQVFDAHPQLRRTLGEHVDRGGELWLLAGNHDAVLGRDEGRRAFCEQLELRGAARDRIRTSPWFLRDGAVHFEHGHAYDPDNAPAHPLADFPRSLGVHFVEEFIVKTGAHKYLNRNSETPLRLFLSSFTMFGPRAPWVIAMYFRAAFIALGRSGARFPREAALHHGRAREAELAEALGVAPEELQDLAALCAEPTLASLPRTVERLYMDRVAGTLLLAGGGLGWAMGLKHARLATLAGAACIAASWMVGHDRYGSRVHDRLHDAALAVGQRSGARAVVFGHAHREAQTDAYYNTGSFAFCGDAPGRPYLRIADAQRPEPERRYAEIEPARSARV